MEINLRFEYIWLGPLLLTWSRRDVWLGLYQWPDCERVIWWHEWGAGVTTMDDYIENEDFTCPACGHAGTRSRDCTQFDCDDGWIDLGELDWQDEGEYQVCDECWGTGVVRWCPSCGADLQLPEWRKAMEPQFDAARE